jgi:hypothetical protein
MARLRRAGEREELTGFGETPSGTTILNGSLFHIEKSAAAPIEVSKITRDKRRLRDEHS